MGNKTPKELLEVLEIEADLTNNTFEEIQKIIIDAWKKLSFQYHPDKNQGDATKEEKLKEINNAKTALLELPFEAFQDINEVYEERDNWVTAFTEKAFKDGKDLKNNAGDLIDLTPEEMKQFRELFESILLEMFKDYQDLSENYKVKLSDPETPSWQEFRNAPDYLPLNTKRVYLKIGTSVATIQLFTIYLLNNLDLEIQERMDVKLFKDHDYQNFQINASAIKIFLEKFNSLDEESQRGFKKDLDEYKEKILNIQPAIPFFENYFFLSSEEDDKIDFYFNNNNVKNFITKLLSKFGVKVNFNDFYIKVDEKEFLEKIINNKDFKEKYDLFYKQNSHLISEQLESKKIQADSQHIFWNLENIDGKASPAFEKTFDRILNFIINYKDRPEFAELRTLAEKNLIETLTKLDIKNMLYDYCFSSYEALDLKKLEIVMKQDPEKYKPVLEHLKHNISQIEKLCSIQYDVEKLRGQLFVEFIKNFKFPETEKIEDKKTESETAKNENTIKEEAKTNKPNPLPPINKNVNDAGSRKEEGKRPLSSKTPLPPINPSNNLSNNSDNQSVLSPDSLVGSNKKVLPPIKAPNSKDGKVNDKDGKDKKDKNDKDKYQDKGKGSRSPC